jgi:hypothetical protein
LLFLLLRPHGFHFSGAKELIKEYWLHHGKKKGEKSGRKSDVRSKASPRRPVASVEPVSEPVTKKRRLRQKTKAESADEEAEEDTRSRKRGRKSNGISRRSSPSPASSDEAHPSPELLEPSTIKKWGNLPSWERHIQAIDTVERTDDGDLFIYFKLYDVRLSASVMSDTLATLP